ncbi:hypothetical protein FB451DRAFT_1195883 [Mycena latifolia]|nr:hypothetical protein FB451DRAFT_1195883 [Mycena latifolia]
MSRRPPSRRLAHQPASPPVPLPQRRPRQPTGNPATLNEANADETRNENGPSFDQGTAFDQFGEHSNPPFPLWNNLSGGDSSHEFGTTFPAPEAEPLNLQVQHWLDVTHGLQLEPRGDFQILPPSHPGSFVSTTPSGTSTPLFPLTVAHFDSPALGIHPGMPDLSSNGHREAPSVMAHVSPPPDPPVPLPIIPAPPVPGRGSLAAMRLQTARTASAAAVYVGFPSEQRGLFEGDVQLPSASPSLSDLIRSLQNCPGIAPALNGLFSNLNNVSCTITWSRKLVEPRDGSDYTSVTTGYREAGSLADHLNTSSVVVLAAEKDDLSNQVFAMYSVAPEYPLFVIYITALSPNIQRLGAVQPSRSRSHTPGPSRTSPATSALALLLKIGTVLDATYIADGFELSRLQQMGFGTAYLQVRQALIIEALAEKVKDSHPGVLCTFKDVTAWAGLKPETYANNRTFAFQARATLQYLQVFSQTAAAQTQSVDVREKREGLAQLLSIFFADAVLGENWREDFSPSTLAAGGAQVTSVKAQIRIYPSALVDRYRHQPFRTC